MEIRQSEKEREERMHAKALGWLRRSLMPNWKWQNKEDNSFLFFLSPSIAFVEQKATIGTSHRRQPSGQNRTKNTYSVPFISCEARYFQIIRQRKRKK